MTAPGSRSSKYGIRLAGATSIASAAIAAGAEVLPFAMYLAFGRSKRRKPAPKYSRAGASHTLDHPDRGHRVELTECSKVAVILGRDVRAPVETSRTDLRRADSAWAAQVEIP